MTTSREQQVGLLLDTCMAVRAGEQVLLVTDRQHAGLAHALARGAETRHAEPVVATIKRRRLYEKDASRTLIAAMQASDVVLLCLPPEHSCQLWHTVARSQASSVGARIGLVFPPATWELDAAALLATKHITDVLALRLQLAERAWIRTPNGTDLRMDLRGRAGFACSSILHQPGETATVPDWGDAEISPVEGSTEGIAVIDGSMAFVGTIRTPIRLEIQAGQVTAITGGAEARRLRRILEGGDSGATNIAEFGIGTVPRGTITGHKDDHLLGTCHIALGHNVTLGGSVESSIHLDGVMLQPTIELDGMTVIRDGRPDPAVLDGVAAVLRGEQHAVGGAT